MSRRRYLKLLKQRREWYKNIRQIYCPAIDDFVFFNSKGFHHLLYNGKGKNRTITEKISRLKILLLAPKILIKHKETYLYSVTERGSKNIEYWIFNKVIEKSRKKILITIILRRIGNGRIIFYSIWKK